MRKNSIISENITIWTIICQILGCFSYKITNKSNFIQNRFHYFDTFRCLLLYLGNEIYFSRFKAKYNYFGWILVAVDFFFTMIWLILFIKNNHRLISLYKLFDTFDNSFEQITKQNFSQKPFYKNKIVILILLLFVMDYFSMFYCVLYLRSDITYALTTAISRALQRSVIPLFLTGYLYLLYSVKIRFEMLQDMWTCNVEIKVNSNSKQFQMIKDLNDIKTLYVQLIGVVESMNLCFGSRLVIMFAQLFYFILLYFYMICTGLPVVVFLLPFYILLILIVTLCSQGLYESMNILPRMLRLPSNKLSERFLIQWYGFIQQLRSSPVYINAAGFFIIDKKLLGSLTMAIASYLVAIFQLAPLMDNIGKKTIISLI